MELILIDTSVWIELLQKKENKVVFLLREFLERRMACTTEPIKAELLSGTLNKTAFNQVANILDFLPFYSGLKVGFWDNKIAEVRFNLARKGVQTNLIDLWIAMIAKEYNLSLFTIDKDFKRIAKFFPVKLIIF